MLLFEPLCWGEAAVESGIKVWFRRNQQTTSDITRKNWKVSNSYNADLSTQKIRNFGKQTRVVPDEDFC